MITTIPLEGVEPRYLYEHTSDRPAHQDSSIGCIVKATSPTLSMLMVIVNFYWEQLWSIKPQEQNLVKD